MLSNNRKKLTVAVAVIFLSVLFLSLPGSGNSGREGYCYCCPEGYDYCPFRYSSFYTDKNVYLEGETVTVKLTNLQDFEYWIEKIEIKTRKFRDDYEVIYSESDVAVVDPASSSWSWKWNQMDKSGNQVRIGRYMIKLKTGCCGYYRTYVTIEAPRDCSRQLCSCKLKCKSSCGCFPLLFNITCNKDCNTNCCFERCSTNREFQCDC